MLTTTHLVAIPAVLPPTFGLQRLIVINSYMKHQARTLCVDEHTHVSGRNGRGKTTLLRLVPLFYGEQPSKMVKPSGEVLRPIRDYMFDSLSAYLVFEYRNHDGIKLVIMYYGSSETPSYLLCDGPYSSELFVKEGKFIESRHMKIQLQTCKRNPTAPLGVMDYQAIIQNRTDQLRGETRQYARRFGLVDRGNLSGIEKIASAMFFKDITFLALKRMAYAVMNDRPEQVLSAATTEKTLSQFFENLRNYRDVMRRAQDFIDGTNAHLRIAKAVRDQRSLAIKANLFSRYLNETVAEAETSLAEIQAQASELAQMRLDQNTRLQSERGKVQGDVMTYENVVSKVNLEERAFAQRDMKRLRDLVTSIGKLETSIESRQEMLRSVRALSDDISGKYAQQETAVHVRYNDVVQPLHVERAEITSHARQSLERIEEDRGEAIEQHLNWVTKETKAYDERYATALGVLQDRRLQYAGLRESEEFEIKRKAIKANEQTALDEQAELNASVRETMSVIAAAKQEFARLEGVFGSALRFLKDKRDVLDRLLSLEAPAQGSLLRHLRDTVPGWYDNIGRIVRDDILLRDDLAPAPAAGDARSLYGVDIALQKIEVSLAAREETLAEEIALALQAVDRQRADVAEVEAQMSKASKQIETLTKDCHVLDTKLVQRKNALEQNRSASVANDRASAEDLSARREEAQILVDAAKSTVEILEREYQGLAKEIDSRRTMIRMQFDRRSAEVKDVEKAAYDRIEKALGEAAADRDATLERLKASCEAELRDGGIDTAALSALQRQIDKEKNSLEEARAARSDVEKYERWLAVGPSERADARERLDLLTIEMQRIDASIARANSESDATNKVLRDRRELTQRKIDATRDRERQVNAFRNEQNTEIEGYEIEEPFELLGLSLESLSMAYARSKMEKQKSITERDQKLQPILSIFVHANKESHIAQASRDMPRNYVDTNENSTVGAIIDVLKRWYDSGHAQSRESLNGECRAACQIFETYFNKLRHFQKRMLTLSRELQNSLDTEMVFDAIRRVSIHLSGRVERVPYWGPLNGLIAEFKRWREIDCAGIPPQTLITQLQDLIQQNPGGRIEEAPENLIDMEIIVDDGTEKRVNNEADLKNVSSNGLSSMILCMIFVAFVNRVRKDERLWLTWALDEIGTIDAGNSKALLDMLAHHHIRLVSASPEGREATLAMFRNHYEILPNFEIQRCVPAQRRHHVG